ncbi:MAG TPA: DNA starvation/stationary phase protection protein [Bacillota bacterium]
MDEKKKNNINFLNQLLSNHFVMYVKLHRYHWFVQGRHFFELHERFETFYTEVANNLDTIAERILMIGGKPVATMTKFLKETTLDEANADDKENEIINQLHHDFQKIVTEIKEVGIPAASEMNDEPTLDMLVSLQGSYEKYMWMLSAYQAYE